MQNFEKDVKTIREIAKLTQDSQIKDTEQLTEPQKSISFIKGKFKGHEESRGEKERETEKPKDNIGIFNKRLENMDTVIDRQEQYSRRNCLLIHGLEEQNNENTSQRIIVMLHESIGQTISP